MRLTKIKLSGFKSFVDPVSIPVSSNLVGIVGPNGCGKSNIIDAVRWVMGESSAKHLRGDTMADVIFNGSSSRKPVGMASVELLFDNSSGALGGPYATYQTIAIKRQVSRDGQSVYMLNGSRCRRKDITDLFLGTGLGTRSYAIIEQGTISRLVEARPEDLRTMIEEAAGVSKYKERRHDTENRIRHTRENLERLNDVRDEVEKQIRHLKQQAKKAESFKTLKAEERQVRKELLAIRWHSYREQVLQNEEREALAKAELESATGRQGDFDRRIAASRDEQTRMQQSVNAIQADLYAIGAEIVRAEQQIKLANQTRDDIESELKRLTSDRQRAVAELDHDKQQLTRIQREIIVASQTLGYAKQLEKSISGLKSCAERIGVEQKEHLDALRTELGRQKECLHVESSRIDQFVAQNRQYAERTQRLSVEKSELQSHRLSEEITELQNEIARLEDEREEIGDQLADLKELADTQKQKFRDLNDTLNDIRSKRQHCEGQIASLERLQQHAMGRDRGALNHWLKERRLESARRLARDIEVDPGWETAAETALGPYLEAVCVEETNPLLEEVAALVDETIAIIETGQGSVAESEEKGPRLIDKVRSSCRIGNLLSRVFCAASLDEARAIASTLDAGESVITADGVWLGKGWIYLNRTRDQKTGVLARERELRGLNDRLTTLEGQSESIEIELNDLEEASAHSERLVEECRDRERKITAELSDRKTALSAKSTRYEQFCRRISQIEHELADLAGTFERNEDSIAKARDRCGEAERKIAELSLRSEALSAWHQSWQRFMTEINELYTDARADGLRREAALANLQSSEQLTGR
ncbi:MAG: chromosome segregation protein SMC, partial [Gammaproteobacteria bacterium]